MPQYSGNIAKVGIKHQPINQWDTIVEIVEKQENLHTVGSAHFTVSTLAFVIHLFNFT
jgi:hypothetical protein